MGLVTWRRPNDAPQIVSVNGSILSGSNVGGNVTLVSPSAYTSRFQARWLTGTGDGDAAVLDSGNDGFDRFYSSSPLLNVLAPGSVPGAASPFTGNVLRTEDSSTGGTGPGQGARNIEVDLFNGHGFTVGAGYYIKLGYRIDSNGVSSVSHHDTTSVPGYRNLTWHTPDTLSGHYLPVIRCEGGDGSIIPYPFYRWVVDDDPAVRLALGTWYRLEFWLEIVGRQGVQATRVGTNWPSAWSETGQVEFRIHPRIYVGNGTTPVITAANYLSLDYPLSGGQTLAEFYAAGRTFLTLNSYMSGTGLTALQGLYQLGLGNNGAEAGNGGIGDYWYYADLDVGEGGWFTEI